MGGSCRAQKIKQTVQGNLKVGSVLGLAVPTASMYHSTEDRPLESVPISLEYLSSLL